MSASRIFPRFAWLVSCWRLLRASADLSTGQARARDRMRRVLLSAVAAAGAKLITIITSLISVPLTLHYLGPELYGIWMVLLSFNVMLAFADMGLGNGILNAVAREHGRGDRVAMRRTVSSGYLMLSGIAILILVGFSCAYSFVPWYKLFNAGSTEARAQAGPALAVFITCFALSIPASVVQKVQIGLQQSFMNSLWQAGGSLLGLVSMLIVIWMQGSLAMLVLALVSAPLVAAVANTTAFFAGAGRDLRPSLYLVSREAMAATGRMGSLFFLLQLIGAMAMGADTIIVAQIAGAATVAQYAVPERMFAIVSMVIAMALAPLWPAYGEAIERGDRDWVRRTLGRSLLVSVVAAGGMSLVLVLLGRPLLHLWVGDAVQPTMLLLLGLGVWRIVEACGNAVAYYLNGANLMRVQVIIGIGSATAKVALKIALVESIGPAGIPWGGAIAFIVTAGIPYLFVIRRQLHVPAERR